jgi:hypothetical protein
MTAEERTQDGPIMDGATEATSEEKEAGRKEQQEQDVEMNGNPETTADPE